MTTKNHTDIIVGAPANASIVNAPLGTLDSALADLELVAGDYVISGGLAGTSASLSISIPALRAFILNTYTQVNTTAATVTASKDNYVDVDNLGAFHITAVNNGAAVPSVFTNSIRLFKAIAGASTVTSVVDLRPTPNINASSHPWGNGKFDVTSSLNPSGAAKGDAQEIVDGVMTAGSAVLTSVSGKFALGDVNKKCFVRLVGAVQVANPTVAISGADGGVGATTLPTGTYTFAYAWATRGFTGETTAGTSSATYVQTVANHKITLTLPALPANAEVAEVFCTVAPGGAFTGVIGYSKTTTFSYVTGNTSNLRAPLATTTAGATLQTTIASYQSATQVTLAATATLANPGTNVLWATDDSASRDAAVTAAIAAGAGEVIFPPIVGSNAGYLLTTGTTINVPRIFFSGLNSKLFYTGAGDCFRIQMSPFGTNFQPGQLTNLVIDGNYSLDGATGVHYGDANQGAFIDLTVQLFNGVGSKGFWMDNRTNWCERHVWDRVWTFANTINVLFDRNGGDVSFAHSFIFNMKTSVGLGQKGVVLQNGIALVNSIFQMTGNCDIASTSLQLLDTATLGYSNAGVLFGITMENGGNGNATALSIAAGASLFGTGVLDMSIGNYTSVNLAPTGALQFGGRFNCPGIYAMAGEGLVAIGGASDVALPGGGISVPNGASFLGGPVASNNGFRSTGGSAAFQFWDRVSNNPWYLYATGGIARILGTGPGDIVGYDLGGHTLSLVAGAPATSTLGANVTSVTFTGNDRRGTIAIVMAGALAANTKIATCTYAVSYGAAAPFVFLINQTAGVGLANVNFYRQAVSTGVSFDLACNQALAAGTYTVGYIVEG